MTWEMCNRKNDRQWLSPINPFSPEQPGKIHDAPKTPDLFLVVISQHREKKGVTATVVVVQQLMKIQIHSWVCSANLPDAGLMYTCEKAGLDIISYGQRQYRKQSESRIAILSGLESKFEKLI